MDPRIIYNYMDFLNVVHPSKYNIQFTHFTLAVSFLPRMMMMICSITGIDHFLKKKRSQTIFFKESVLWNHDNLTAGHLTVSLLVTLV